MRAVVIGEYGPPEVLKVSEIPIPEPGDGEISIDVAYAGVGFADTMLRAGAFPVPTPQVPGIEVTGRVREVGNGVEGFSPGQLVAALLSDTHREHRAGGYAEVAVAHHQMASSLPDNADLPHITAAISNGIHPAAQVIGAVGHDPERAPNQCTDVILNEDLGSGLLDLTPNGAVDVVIDLVGGKPRALAFDRLAPFGRHIIVGNASGEDPPISGDGAWSGTRTLAGRCIGSTAHLNRAAIGEALRTVATLVTTGALQEPAPAIQLLANARDVHQAFADRSAPAKTVLAL